MGQFSSRQHEKQWENPPLSRPAAFKKSLKKMPLSNPDYRRSPSGPDQRNSLL